MQVAFRVIRNNATVTRATQCEVDLNVWKSGIRTDVERCLANASESLVLSSLLASIRDCPTASAVARFAAAEGPLIFSHWRNVAPFHDSALARLSHIVTLIGRYRLFLLEKIPQ